jgi:Cu(I)/Ag(I) efflux system membrane fusion protein
MSFTESAPAPPARRTSLLAARVLLVRLRLVLALGGVLAVVAFWPLLTAWWDRLTRPALEQSAVSPDTEYWCPMCPGVLSDWPGKCPVCSMSLVRRKKGEAVPLPDGVLSRMQLSPYRVQLADVRTAPLDYQPLRRDVVLAGLAEPDASPTRLLLTAAVSERELPFLTEGQSVQAASDLLPGHAPFAGRIRKIGPYATPDSRSLQVQVEVDDPARELRPGMLLTARADAPVARQPWGTRALAEEWRNRLAIDLAAHALLNPSGTMTAAGAESLVRLAGPQSLCCRGLVLALPESAVVDHGDRKVVFVESGPGMFDGVEVVLGPRCGDSYPVLHGLEPGQRVVLTGAFLLDAETRLNPALAAGYFGARTASGGTTSTPAQPAAQGNQLSAADRALAAKQKVCPVTGEPLDSMGGPVRVEVAGRVVFVCCAGCEAPLRKDPHKYLGKLPAP